MKSPYPSSSRVFLAINPQALRYLSCKSWRFALIYSHSLLTRSSEADDRLGWMTGDFFFYPATVQRVRMFVHENKHKVDLLYVYSSPKNGRLTFGACVLEVSRMCFSSIILSSASSLLRRTEYRRFWALFDQFSVHRQQVRCIKRQRAVCVSFFSETGLWDQICSSNKQSTCATLHNFW